MATHILAFDRVPKEVVAKFQTALSHGGSTEVVVDADALPKVVRIIEVDNVTLFNDIKEGEKGNFVAISLGATGITN